jgi:putative ABC transport system substrate-binding protein
MRAVDRSGPIRSSTVGASISAAGGLISYGPMLTGIWRHVGIYAGRNLKGEKPADMPVSNQLNSIWAAISKTAKALGLTVPPST